MKILKTFTLCLFLAAFFSCDNEKIYAPDVNASTIISQRLYEKPGNDNTIIDAKIDGDVLRVTLSAGGCDGSTWKPQLIDRGIVAESYPAQRFARIILNNKEACTAVISRNFSFDLKPLQISGNDKISIHLSGWNESLLYVY